MSPHSEVVLRHGVLFIIGQPEADFRRPTSVSFAAYTSVSSMLSALFSDLEKAVEELRQTTGLGASGGILGLLEGAGMDV